MRHRLALIVLPVLALLALPAAPAFAAAPANDAFASPITLTSEAPALAGDNLRATSEPSEVESFDYAKFDDCATFTSALECGNSVWYAFTAPTTANYIAETCDKGTEVDTVLYAYTGAALGALTEVARNDDSCDGGYGGNGSRITIAATAGTTYRLQVVGYNAAQGTFSLRAHPSASPPAPPAVDTRITRYQSVVSDAPGNNQDGTHSGSRRTATFAFYSSAPGATFECSLDAGAYVPCSSPAAYDDLAVDGVERAFRVRSIQGTTDPTPSVQRFTLDEAAPETSILTGPAEGATVPNAVVFTRATTERTTDFLNRCTLDGIGPYACNSTSQDLTGLCDRSHSFGIQAMDEAGNLDATPATRAFSITGGGACADPQIALDAAGTTPTGVDISAQVTTGGVPLQATLRYGTTTAYGETVRRPVDAASPSVGFGTVDGLVPDTTYHYEVTVANGAGVSASTGDQTFTTATLPGGETVPDVTVGTPVIAGRHAARIPITLNGGTTAGGIEVRVLIADTSPVTGTSGVVSLDGDLSPSVLPATTPVDALDLRPGTTYHYRVLVRAKHSSLSDERTFTTAATPPAPAPAPTPPAGAGTPTPPAATPFKLKKGNVAVGKVTRSAKRITVKVTRVPKGTKLTLKVKGSRLLAKAKATASASGKATFKVKLGAKARKALKSKRLKRVTFTVTATPPGGKPSSVTVTKRL